MSHELREDVGRVMIDFTQMKAFSEDPLILTEGTGSACGTSTAAGTSTGSPGRSA